MKSATDRTANHLPSAPVAIVSLCACVLLIIGTAAAPPSELTAGASWIWHPEATGDSACRVYLATSFTLPDKAARAEYLCTADNEYTIFVNGRKVGSSPGPGNLGDWWRRLDKHDVTGFLKAGTNIVAVEAYNVSGPAGFIGMLDIRAADGETLPVITDGSWSAALDPPAGWPGSPTLPFGKPAADLGKPPVSPWGYPAPPSSLSRVAVGLRTELSRKLVLPERVVELQGPGEAMSRADSILQADGKTALVELPAGKEVAIVLDFGREVVGHFRAGTSGGAAVLDLAYGESLQECLQDKPFQPIDRRTAGPGEWKWTDLERRAFRYLKVTISDCSAPLEIDYFGLDLVGYPVANKGDFRCSDELLNRIWDVGRYTTALCMQDYYEDGIKRDRMLWMGDLRVEALSGYYAFGDYKLAKRDLIRLADIQTQDGAIPAVGPAVSALILPDYCAYWVSGLWDYYLHSGDKDTVELLYPYVKRQMQWFTRQLNEHSLIRDADRKGWWCFIDWADIEKKDEVTALEAIYHHALTSAANLAGVAGDKEEAAGHRARALRVKESINQRLWLEDPGAYADCRTAQGISSRISQQSNCLAVLFGIADPNRWESIRRTVFDESKVQPTTTPYMNFYVVKALYRMHRDQQALDLIRSYWGGMLRRGATSYWETYDPRRPDDFVPDSSMSFCHGWSAGVTSMLPAEVVGIKPTAPGFREVSVIPHLADLQWAEARVPTPHGDVFVTWKRSKDSAGLTGTLEVPAASRALIGIPMSGTEARISLDGIRVWDRGEVADTSPAKLSAAWSDDRYVYLKLPRGGKYKVEAIPTAQ